jgi:predicted small lipoprotein YifL
MSKISAFSVIVAILLFLNGCGYKAPPYYEKPVVAKDSSVAL